MKQSDEMHCRVLRADTPGNFFCRAFGERQHISLSCFTCQLCCQGNVVLPIMLTLCTQLAKRLFNATVEAADGEVPVWDPSVRFFRLYRNGELKAHFYLDSFARPGGAFVPRPNSLTRLFFSL
jgi:hypothetical protein